MPLPPNRQTFKNEPYVKPPKEENSRPFLRIPFNSLSSSRNIGRGPEGKFLVGGASGCVPRAILAPAPGFWPMGARDRPLVGRVV